MARIPRSFPSLLLDAFGTLFDSRGLSEAAARAVARAVGFPDWKRLHAAWWAASAAEDWPNSPYRPMRSHLATSLRAAFRALKLSDDAAAAERGAATQLELLAQAPLLDGAREALARLGDGRRLILVTNADEALIRPLLARHGLAGAFAHVQTSEGARAYKPDPRLFRAALAALGVAPEAALVVGDSYDEDVRGAAATGLAAAWLNPKGAAPPASGPRPLFTVATLAELGAAL